MTSAAFLLPLLGAALFIAGLLLLRCGRWPRRVGTTPHCSKCDYILSSLVTVPDQLPRCPECGTPATPWRITLGERPIRPSLIWSGCALALLGVLVLTSLLRTNIRHFQWIHLESLGGLLGDLDSGSPHVRDRSWNEIMRRDNAGLLSESDKSSVVDRGLRARRIPIWHGDVISDYVALRYLDDKLTATQTDRFFDRIADVQLTVRPVVGAQSPLPFVVRSVGPGPAGWQLVMAVSQTQMDDRAPDGPASRAAFETGFGGELSAAVERPKAPPGAHHLRVRVQLLAAPNLGGTSVDFDNPAPGQHVVTRNLTGSFQIVEGQTPIAVVTTPDAGALVRMIEARVTPSHGYRPDALNVYARAHSLPCDAAFTVSIRARTREYSLGTWVVKKDTNIGSYWLPEEPKLADLDGAEIVFRSDEDLARRTVDFSQIWRGQIVIPVAKRKD